MKSKDEPDVSPPNPFDYQEYNPYNVDATKTKTSDWKASGEVYMPTKIDNLFGSFQEDHRKAGKYYKPVDPKQIPDAVNNKFSKTLAYSFSLVENMQSKVARIIISDKDHDNGY